MAPACHMQGTQRHEYLSLSLRQSCLILPIFTSSHISHWWKRALKVIFTIQTKAKVQALHNALWIQELIQSCPYTGGTAIHYLIERNLIRPEELLGIENLIVGGGKILKERQTHSRLILKTQSELENKKDVNIGQKLADVAAAKSLKNVKKARLRAVLSA